MTAVDRGILDRELHEAAGAVFGTVRSVERPRHYGDPAAEYRAATTTVAVADRSFRRRLALRGRAPVRMLDGIVTASVPPGPQEILPGVGAGRAAYSAVLTAKGRMVTDLRILRLDPGGHEDRERGAGSSAGPALLPVGEGRAEALLLEVPVDGAPALVEHLGRFLPPRFARVEDVSGVTGMLTVLGPWGADLVSREALGLRVEGHELDALAEGEYRVVDLGGGEAVHALRTGEVATPALDVVAGRATLRALWARLLEAGASPVGDGVWETLRVEAGRPAFGVDMDGDTIPVEAGIHGRAIDYGKGCYTGQEVIVRIRDRGHVNRHLRGLRLGEAPNPAPGTELYAPQLRGERGVGTVTSSVQSPRAGETLALGYLRREVTPGTEVRVGDVEGPPALAVDLDRGWGREAGVNPPGATVPPRRGPASPTP